MLRSNAASTSYDKNDPAAVTAHVAHVNEEIAAMLAHHSNMDPAKEYGLVVDGATLAYALKPAHSKQFLDLACRCKVCQRGDVVEGGGVWMCLVSYLDDRLLCVVEQHLYKKPTLCNL